MIKNVRRQIPTLALAGGAAVNALVYLSCIFPLHVIECTGSLQSISLAIFVLSGVSSAAYSLFRFYKKHGTYKDQLISTGIVGFVAFLIALVISVISPAYDMAVFCVTLVGIWLSLSANNRSRRASIGLLLFAAFLAGVMVFVHHDHPALIPLLYAAFSAGAALRHTGARKLAEWGCLGVVGSILALIGIMGLAAVIEMGMPPEGYEGLILYEGIDRTIPHVDKIMAVGAVFMGIAPFYWAAKDLKDHGSKA